MCASCSHEEEIQAARRVPRYLSSALDWCHTCTALMLRDRINPKGVSELLGPLTVTMTLDRYSHVWQDLQQAAMDVMDRLLG